MRRLVETMRRGPVWIVVILVLGLLVAPMPANAQELGQVYRIGFLAFGHRPVSDAVAASPLAAFRQALRELGYAEGRNLVIEERWAEARLDRLPVLAGELVPLRPDVIVASGASAVRAAKRVTQQIPIVIAGAADPVAEGLVASLAHPDINVTGVSVLPGREFEGKRLELLREAVPKVTRVAVILDSTSRLDPAPLQTAARALGLTLLLSGETESPEEYRDAFTEMVRDRADAVYAPETPINVRQRRLIVELALKHRLPAIYGSREFVEAGGLMAYGPNFVELFRRAAIYVDKILKGATPHDLPVEQPRQFELVINTKTMKAFGLSFPPSILILADEVIQ
ncbi:MAG: ABC transporter substrate-binding protein [Candidatus Tectomicrobia bacterium]|nr:ABC transporter substrate-binding protein [Candidatus Tectomicrobia bacterium]